jgi:hypothetical protein
MAAFAGASIFSAKLALDSCVDLREKLINSICGPYRESLLDFS